MDGEIVGSVEWRIAMKLAMLRGRATGTEGMGTSRETEEPRLCLVGRGAEVLQWPVEPTIIGRGGQSGAGGEDARGDDHLRLEPVTITAEVRMRRFANDRVSEARYEATASIVDRSPHAILAALAERFAALDGDDVSCGDDDRVIVEVRVVA